MTMTSEQTKFDTIIVGGGAAGLMTAVLLSRQCPTETVAVLDGAKRLGAKILISGGGRCNVTNVSVTAKDFHGGSRNVVKRVLKAFSAKETVEFFESLGVTVHEEAHGKLFPDSNKARTVLDTLIESATSQGVKLLTGHRVEQVNVEGQLFHVESESSAFQCQRVVLATGGRSIPKTGSDGFGYELARVLGHTMTRTYPALTPLLLQGDFHESLSGVSHDVELSLRCVGAKPVRFAGSLLWTHFGVSGPVVLDVSRHWHAADIAGQEPKVAVNFVVGQNGQQFEATLIEHLEQNAGDTLRKFLSERLPNRFVEKVLAECQIPQPLKFAELTKVQRKNLVQHLTEYPLLITNSRGFGYAEATAGGIPLSEVNPSTMESRCCAGLYLVGEILDVDGRLGGFNFQWAWSSAAVAAEAIARSGLSAS